jgi:enoyl-CoA hydratase/carnithine racemase
MYSGDFIDAKEAERIGLVNKVVPHENLMPEAVELANRLVNEPPLTLAQIKRALHNGMINTLEQQLYFEAYAQKFCWGTRDFKESITAFFEKRAPLFTGE